MDNKEQLKNRNIAKMMSLLKMNVKAKSEDERKKIQLELNTIASQNQEFLEESIEKQDDFSQLDHKEILQKKDDKKHLQDELKRIQQQQELNVSKMMSLLSLSLKVDTAEKEKIQLELNRLAKQNRDLEQESNSLLN